MSQAGGGDPSKAGFFLNVTLKNEFIENEVMRLLKSDQLSVQEDEEEAKSRH